ncbi:MAG: fused response regulator/phosphatase [Spirochaetes bacterium]|nr:MAG: fused response regulator/phosphatase [Spirochaetota bacterium]
MPLNHNNPATEGRSVLVIDDSRLSRAIVKGTLSKLNMRIVEATDGVEGLRALEKEPFDLVLVDIVMPNMDGFGFLQAFKARETADFIPVILMTGSDDLNSKIKGLTVGADDFLLKPLNEKELIARVNSLLRLKSAHDELYLKNMQIERELEYAKRLQQYIIPRDFSAIPRPAISGRYLPIANIGGDLFDCYQLPGGGVGLVIADVTGHGIPAALVMSMSKTLFSVYAMGYRSTKELLSRVNNEMREFLMDTHYLTAFYLIYDPSDETIRFTNAGHARPLYFRRRTGKVIALDTDGLFLGISEKDTYGEKALRVEEGDTMILYTDGITELRNRKDEYFGESRLATFLRQNAAIPGEEFCDKLLAELNAFAPLDERADDIAFLCVNF